MARKKKKKMGSWEAAFAYYSVSDCGEKVPMSWEAALAYYSGPECGRSPADWEELEIAPETCLVCIHCLRLSRLDSLACDAFGYPECHHSGCSGSFVDLQPATKKLRWALDLPSDGDGS